MNLDEKYHINWTEVFVCKQFVIFWFMNSSYLAFLTICCRWFCILKLFTSKNTNRNMSCTNFFRWQKQNLCLFASWIMDVMCESAELCCTELPINQSNIRVSTCQKQNKHGKKYRRTPLIYYCPDNVVPLGLVVFSVLFLKHSEFMQQHQPEILSFLFHTFFFPVKTGRSHYPQCSSAPDS